MKDKATEWLMGLNPFDKVKGHTKIELTDVKTGKKQVIEKDNTFQAGVLASYMRSMGAYNNNPYANSTWAAQPIWRNLCGGIFCFEDEIDLTNGEVEYMPAGNTMVANGAYMVNNAGTPIELGSYNEVESSTSGNDSVTFVYDWLTSQGNGTISCVCLTTEIGGYIGYGNKSGTNISTRKNFAANQSSRSISGIVYKNNAYSFTLDSENSKVSVIKTPTEITKGSIFDGIAEDSFDVTYSGTISGTSLEMPRYMGGGKVALFPYSSSRQSVSSGSTYSFLIYDLETDTATVKTITNNTGVALMVMWNSTNHPHYAVLGITEKNIYMRQDINGSSYQDNTQSPIYAIDLTTGNYKYIGIVSLAYHASYIDYNMLGMLSEGIISFPNSNEIFDETNETIYYANGSISEGYQYVDEHDAIMSPSGGAYKNPLILATVNNLETPVVKTAAQTMKITYTLSKASE